VVLQLHVVVPTWQSGKWISLVAPNSQLYFLQFFWLVASSLDEHLGRGIRHDDVYEELAPTTYCKTNKKNALSQSPAL
jgi:hypothetical protein